MPVDVKDKELNVDVGQELFNFIYFSFFINLFSSSSVMLYLYLVLVMIVDHAHYLRAYGSCCIRLRTLSEGLAVVRQQHWDTMHRIHTEFCGIIWMIHTEQRIILH